MRWVEVKPEGWAYASVDDAANLFAISVRCRRCVLENAASTGDWRPIQGWVQAGCPNNYLPVWAGLASHALWIVIEDPQPCRDH